MNKKLKNKSNQKVSKQTKSIKISLKTQKIFCTIIAILFLILFIVSFNIKELIPATLITLSLELFSFSYIISEKNGKKKYIYTLFIIGVIILLTSVFYTIIHTI